MIDQSSLFAIPNPGDWLSKRGAQDLLGVTAPTLYRYVHAGALSLHRPTGAGAPPMFWRDEVLRLKEARDRIKGDLG